ncbi:MAG: BPTD_2524 family lipoprotein [Bordetella sp.]|uniref:BPTD_2524 family lipoprotein n=1 Tax=Bordetella sp. TaxID=28081 RepID=UPI003F7BF89F
MLGCAALALVGGLAGCANTGLMQTKGVSDSFIVNTDVESAYRRALEYLRVCDLSRAHPYGQTYGIARDNDPMAGESFFDAVSGGGAKKNTPTQTALGRIRVFKVGEEAKILELFEAKSESIEPVTARVTVTVLGTGIWDKAELAAARKSIQSATPVCRSPE